MNQICTFPILYDCLDRGETSYGASGDSKIQGTAVLKSECIGKGKDTLQLKFLHISRASRKQGLQRILFEKAVERAQELGAKNLYISSTPSENTMNFYLGLACILAKDVDPELFKLEPDEVHWQYALHLATSLQ